MTDLDTLHERIGHGCISFNLTTPRVVISIMDPKTKQWTGGVGNTVTEALLDAEQDPDDCPPEIGCFSCGRTTGEATATCGGCGLTLCCTDCGLAELRFHFTQDCPGRLGDT